MGCGCKGGSAGKGGTNDTLGFYVILPDGSVMPQGVNPTNPAAGAPPYLMYAEAHSEVVLTGGGTIHRLKRKR
jgi:hypothetical protein